MPDQLSDKENVMTFSLTEKGEVLWRPDVFIQPSSWNASPIVEKIAPEAADFMQYLVQWKYKEEFDKLKSE